MAKKGRKDLFRPWKTATLTGRRLDEVAFPLGGIGTGTISLGGWGQLRDWEIMNRPAKGFVFPASFFSIAVREKGGPTVARVLQGPSGGSFNAGGHSAPRSQGEGLPRFRKVGFRGSFPFARVLLDDPDVPVSVVVEAFNPFIPLNDKDSSIPTAILLFRIRNTGKKPVSGTVFGNLRNMIGRPEKGTPVNEARTDDEVSGLFLSNPAFGPDSPRAGTMALASPAKRTKTLAAWPEDWADSLFPYWRMINDPAAFPPGPGETSIGTVGVEFAAAAGEETVVPFIIAWHFPVCENYWRPAASCEGKECAQKKTWRNYYASVWPDAWDVARYVASNLDRLRAETRAFHDALFATTVPGCVLDAVSSQISVLKSTTCLRLEDGTFYGFEGSNNEGGCCEGSCSHVWNYAQALPNLFPALQRSMREAEYAVSLRDDGWVQFRMPLPMGTKPDWTYHPAADGQMGGVIQVYREWLVSGDDAWLRKVWPSARRALEFAWTYWDADRDGVMEGMQHNTYDIEFHGPNTMMGSLYLCALRAAEEISRRLGDDAKAEEYRQLFVRGSAWTDKNLFNGEYYEQKVVPDARDAWPETQRKLSESHGRDGTFPWPKWQYGSGCIADQLIGQWYAHMLGLGHLYDPRRVRTAMRSIVKYNWRTEMYEHPCSFRVYALNDEPGLLIGTWPRGRRPVHGFYFADEVWTGIEYQVAAHLVYEGMIEEALTIVAGVRSRYTGERRNPWDEFECGHHYARAMASYSLLPALTGIAWSAPDGRLAFLPPDGGRDFAAFFTAGTGWGTLSRKTSGGNKVRHTIELRYGALALKTLVLAAPSKPKKCSVSCGDGEIPATVRRTGDAWAVDFAEPVRIAAGEKLTVVLRS